MIIAAEKIELLGRPVPEKTKRFLESASKRVQNDIRKHKDSLMYPAYFNEYKDEPRHQVRLAMSFAKAIRGEKIYIFDDELLTGQIYHAPESMADEDLPPKMKKIDYGQLAKARIEKELPELITFAGDARSWISPLTCTPGHVGWHYDWILAEGVEGMFRRIDDAMDKTDDKGRDILKSMKICWQAVLDWNDLHIDELKKRAEKAKGKRKESTLREIEVCSRVPRQGARNFREAVQSFHFTYSLTMHENPFGGNGPGRLDYYLWPYLEKDLEKGIETKDSARMLIDELFIRFHERLLFKADGFVETIVVGGCHPDGTHSINPLSYIMIESIAGLQISHPSVYIRMPEKAPKDFYELAARDLVEGGNRAQVVSDAAVIRAMTRNNAMPMEDARMFMCGGCMEISPHGMNGDLLFTGFFNTAKILELVINGGRCMLTGNKMLAGYSKTLEDYVSFEELYRTFAEELTRILHLTFKRMDITSEEWSKNRVMFLLSSQVENCIERGRSINDGGAKYEDFGSTPLGIPNIGDSLTAIKNAVFGEQFIGAGKLLEALKNDFKDNENLRRRLMHLPKFGQGHSGADGMVNRVLTSVCDIYDSYINRIGGRIKPMIMTFMMAPITGAALGATADGRKAGTPITQGLTPQSFAMTKGISTAMMSANSLDLGRFSGGTTSMWDLCPELATVENVQSIVKAFIQSGGHMYQGNTTDVDVLKDAMENPDKYPHMLVRVGGYSGKFVTLSREIQEEIITRRRHGV